MGVAGIVEFVGGILIMIGLVGSSAAFISSGQMAIAFFKVHVPRDWNPLVNDGELALIYCFLFLFIASKGSGIWSVEANRNRPSPTP